MFFMSSVSREAGQDIKIYTSDFLSVDSWVLWCCYSKQWGNVWLWISCSWKTTQLEKQSFLSFECFQRARVRGSPCRDCSHFPPSAPHLQGLVILSGWSPSHIKAVRFKACSYVHFGLAPKVFCLLQGVKLQAHHKECFGKWFSFLLCLNLHTSSEPIDILSMPGFPGFCSAARLEVLRAGYQELRCGRDSEVSYVTLKFYKGGDCGSGVEQLAGGLSWALTSEQPFH